METASPLRIRYKRPHLYGKQEAFVDAPARYTVVEASTKTGKTVACIVWLVEQALKGRRGQNYWWVAPTYATAGIAFERLKAYLKAGNFPPASYNVREGDQAVDVLGRPIWFKGADKPDSLYGEDVYAAVFDEASRAKPDAWYALRSTLTATRGPVKIIGNVRGRKNWAYTLARRAEAGAAGYAYFKLTAWDAVEGGVLERAEVEDAQATLPADVFKELYLAEPADDGGNPFGLKAIELQSREGLAPGPAEWFGVDLAKSVDYTVVCGLNAAGDVCTLERWQGNWKQTVERIRGMVGNVLTLVDSTGVGDAVLEQLQQPDADSERAFNFIGFKFTGPSKQQIMEGLATAIQGGTISFPEGWLVNELETFEYEYTRTGVRYTAPEGLHDDGVCALALAVRMRADAAGMRVELNDDGMVLNFT